jgi:signal transduction histidine kinase
MRQELDALGARVRELEQQFQQGKMRTTCAKRKPCPVARKKPAPEKLQEQVSRPARPILYEKEQLGFAYSGNRLESLHVTTFSGLDVSNAIRLPLVETGQPIGSVVVEPQPERAWSPEDASLADAVAQRVSQQIQSLHLLAAAERSRVEAQAAIRRFTREGWDAYLDGIHQNELVGYAYDQSAVESYEEELPDQGFNQPLTVTGEQVGSLFCEIDPTKPLSEGDKAMIGSIGQQLTQQIENLRLISDAARARAEAEAATRLLTRQAWQDFAEDKEDANLTFVYDSKQVIPVDPESIVEQPGFTQPLTVRGEVIGQLATLDDKEITPEDANLVATIATQVSLHIETLRLTEELQKRAKELEKLDRLKSSFLANMSHELRTPLNSILGFADVIIEGLDGPLTDNMDNDLRLIQKNGQHLLHLINDVLDMAKIESGKMNLNLEKFFLNEIFEDVFNITSSLASEKMLVVQVEPDSETEIELLADRIRLRQVMINLVNNAIKFTDKGGKISVQAHRNGDHVLIKVCDNGLGIPSTHLESIFQEFTQVDTSTTRKVGGTGLGLPISRRLIEMHGGRIWAESSGISGEGSTLFVDLPIEAKVIEPAA